MNIYSTAIRDLYTTVDEYKRIIQDTLQNSRETFYIDFDYIVTLCRYGYLGLLGDVLDLDDRIQIETIFHIEDGEPVNIVELAPRNKTDACLLWATVIGNEKSIQYLLDRGATNYLDALYLARRFANLRAIIYANINNISNFETACDRSTECFLIRRLPEQVANDLFTALCDGCFTSEARLVIQNGNVTNFEPWFRMINRYTEINETDIDITLRIPYYPNYMNCNIACTLMWFGCPRTKLQNVTGIQHLFTLLDEIKTESRLALVDNVPRVLSDIVAEYLM